MKEKILNALVALGFDLEQLDDFGYGFQYEGTNFIWMPNNDDECFLNIAIPAILEKGDADDKDFYELMNMLNSNMKYVKANTFGDSLWLFYERDVYDENEDLERILTRMIVHLDGSLMLFRKAIREANKEPEDDTDNDESQVIDTETVEENNNDE